MVISLYVCEIPNNISKKDIDNIFAEIEGFKDSRIKVTNDKRKIAFIDYETEKDAKFALETLQGFRFSQEDRGLIIKISDNSKTGSSQTSYKARDDRNNRKMLSNKKRRGNSSDASEIEDGGHNAYKHSNRRRERSRSISSGGESPIGVNPGSSNNNMGNNNFTQNIANKMSDKHISTSSYNATNKNLNENLALNTSSNISSGNMSNYPQINSNPLNATPNILDLINLFASNNPNSNPNQNTNKPYTLTENTSSKPIPNQTEPLNPFNNILECLQNLQTVQLISSLAGTNSANPMINQTNSQDILTPTLHNINQNVSNPKNEAVSNSHKTNIPSNSYSSSTASKFYNNFFKFDDQFKDRLKFKKNSTNIVYVEGLPLNVTEREVAHMFRPFQGFKSVRLVIREKNGEKSIICFADFENMVQSTICINTLQGYRFDKNDLIGLHFSYGVSKNK